MNTQARAIARRSSHRDPPRSGAAIAMRAAAAIALSWLLFWPIFATADVAVPPLKARVTDTAGLLDAPHRQALEAKLAAFEQEKGSQVAVLIVPTTAPETIEQYSIRVTDAWKLGRKDADDGVLLLVAKDDHALRIEVGQGLEGVIPDAIANRIVDETIIPRFRDGDFAGGIEAGVDRVLGLVRGEPLPPPQTFHKNGRKDPLQAAGPFLIGLLFFGQFLRRMLGPLVGGIAIGGIAFLIVQVVVGVVGLAAIAAVLGFVLTLFGLGGMGGWMSMGGRGGFGGGSDGGGGGFSGGGGGFSGGGASGRW